MSDRKVTRIYCSRRTKAHEIGAVYATTDGWKVRLLVPIDGVAETEAVWEEWTKDPERVLATEAWCKTCKKRHHVAISNLIESGRVGQRSVALVAEGMYVDPVGVLERRRAQRE